MTTLAAPRLDDVVDGGVEEAADPAAAAPSRWGAVVVSAVCAVATAVAYLPGSGKDIDYDGTETVAYFVRTPSLLDSLLRQREWNNHPLFSFVEHLVYSTTGRADATTMRIAPIVFAALAVGIVGGAIARRWGPLAGVAGALVLAVNPQFLYQSRCVRGYSLLVLCGVASTLLLSERLAGRSTTRWWPYTAWAAAGLATHLFFAPVLLIHLVWIVDRRRSERREVADRARAATEPFVRACILGAVIWIPLAHTMLATNGGQGRSIWVRYPVEVVDATLGHSLLAMALVGAVGAFGAVVVARRHGRELGLAAGMTAAVFAGIWLVVAPAGATIRWFVWLVPAVSVVVGAAVHARRWLAPLVLVAVVATASVSAPGYASDAHVMPEAARLVDTATDAGLTPCVLSISVPTVLSITDRFEPVVTPADLAQCDLVISIMPTIERPLVAAATKRFGPSQRVNAAGGLLWLKHPLPAQVWRDAGLPNRR